MSIYQVLRRVALQISAIAASVEAADHPYEYQQHAIMSPMNGIGNASYAVGPPQASSYHTLHLPTPTLAPSTATLTALHQFSPTTRQMFETATAQPYVVRSPPQYNEADLPTSGYNVFASFETGESSTGYGAYEMEAYGVNVRDSLGGRTEMDVEEKFGHLRFDSSPSTGGSP